MAPAAPPQPTAAPGGATGPGAAPWPVAYPVVWHPPGKGFTLGRPHSGPGALANVGIRLAARLLDVAVFLPLFAGLIAAAIALEAPHIGPLFPTTNGNPGAPVPFPGIFAIEFTVIGVLFVTSLLWYLYEVVATARYGRTLGKAWMHIRPVRLDGTPVGWGSASGRAAISWVAGCFASSWVGLVDPLFCCWDPIQQCLHDKVAGTIVITDR